eukprot:g20116.t1
MVHDRKVLSFVANRAQVLYKAASEPPHVLTDVEEATSGAVDAIDHISGCAGEHLSDVEGFFGSLDGGGKLQSLKYKDIWDVLEWNTPILGADVVEAEELGIGNRNLAE